MKVLFISILYPLPGFRNIYVDLMNEFVSEGHDVFVVSSTRRQGPHDTHLSKEGKLTVLRVKTDRFTEQNNLIKKGIVSLTIENSFKRAIKKYLSNEKFDLVLYPTPPITLKKAVKFVKKRDGALSYLMLKDIFPQNAVDIGLFKDKGIAHKYFRIKEKGLYKISDFIGCMSQANVEFVLENNPKISPFKVEVCPNSVSISEREKKNNKSIKEKYKIPDDSVVYLYGGNLGKPQGVEFLISCLKDNSKKEDRFFVICGQGTEFNKVKEYYDSSGQENMLLLDQLPKEEYDELVSACDVGLIFLDHRFTIPNFPSRILSYMEYSMPVIAATDKNTDIGKIITENKFGYWCESKNVADFRALIDKMSSDKKEIASMGERAFKYLQDNWTVDVSFETIVKHINKQEH